MPSTIVVPRHAPRSRQRGQMGIIGALLGLVILALVLFFVISHFVTAKNNQQAQAQAADLITMVANAQALYHGSSTGFASVTDTVLVDNGTVPKSLVSGTNIVSPFGDVTVGPANLFATSDGISFTYADVPQSQCSKFVTEIASNVARVTVGGSVIEDQTAGTAFSPVALGTACATGNNVAVVATAEM